MVAQVIVHAPDRPAAITKLRDCPDRVRITGICTNIPLLRRVLADNVFRNGIYDTDFLPHFPRRIDGSDELKVLAPAAAIFYSTPTPTEPEYVSVGDRISVRHTLCQLEAMKIFSPLKLADFNTDFALYDEDREYEVTRSNMASGQQVNAGDLVFVVRPA